MISAFQEEQKKVLGPLYLRSWPVVTPSKADPEKPYENFNFLYADSGIGKVALQNLLALLNNISTKIVINLGLSGAGKTHLLVQLAQRGECWVLFYDCGSNAREIGNIIEDDKIVTKFDTLMAYEQFAGRTKLAMLNFQLAQAYTLLRLLRDGALKEPGQFLRYLENGGQADVRQAFVVLRRIVEDLSTSQHLKNLVLTEIKQLGKKPVVEAWDEAGLLTQWGAGLVPFSNHPNNPRTRYDPTSGSLIDAGSAFTLACRLARESDAKTIFCGTALRLSNVEADVSKDLLKRVKTTTDPEVPRVLEPWSADVVLKNLREDLRLDDVPPTTLDTIAYVLQGRPRLTTVFKGQLYHTLRQGKEHHEQRQALYGHNALMRALEETEQIAINDFRRNIDQYVRGPETTVTTHLREAIEQREQFMKDLTLKGYVDVNAPKEHDLVSAGIIHLETLHATKARYRPLEPLMLHALYQYLEVDKGYDFERLLAEWTREVVGLLNQNRGDDGRVGEQKGLAAEVLLALVLSFVAKELDGRPLTDHELFAEQKGTFLDHYTLRATSFQHDTEGGLWADLLKRRRTDLLVLPPQAMGPDLFGLLSCLPHTASYARFGGPHVIPLTAGVKIRSSSRGLSTLYRANYLTTDPWAIFMRKGGVVQGSDKDRKEAEILLRNTFVVGSRRALRISFTYRPLPTSHLAHPSLEDGQLHIKFDFHHAAFESVLKRSSEEAARYLKRFADF
ncbi:hypothetical protein QOT17_019778 [Balamuthia mandrillaris]